MARPYILLIEDDPDDRRLTVRLLRQAYVDGDIVTLSSGGKALQYLFGTGEFAGRDVEHRPELILLDLRLPDMHGLEVLRCLQADARTKDIPVVVLTSSHSEEDLVESYRLGATSYLRKSAAQIGLCCLISRSPTRRTVEQSAADSTEAACKRAGRQRRKGRP